MKRVQFCALYCSLIEFKKLNSTLYSIYNTIMYKCKYRNNFIYYSGCTIRSSYTCTTFFKDDCHFISLF